MKHKCIKSTGSFSLNDTTTDQLAGMLPEYFAKYRFTTHDGVDSYVGDKHYLISRTSEIYEHATNSWANNYEDHKRFSTHEAAQSYLDSLKPKSLEELIKEYHRGSITIEIFCKSNAKELTEALKQYLCH